MKCGIQIGLNNQENLLTHEIEYPRYRFCFEVNPDLVTECHQKSVVLFLFVFFFLLCHPLGQLYIVFGSKMAASGSQDCMLSLSYPARNREYFSQNSWQKFWDAAWLASIGHMPTPGPVNSLTSGLIVESVSLELYGSPNWKSGANGKEDWLLRRQPQMSAVII